MAHRLGVDVGGTFTDLLLVHDETGNLHRVKTPSTSSDPSGNVGAACCTVAVPISSSTSAIKAVKQTAAAVRTSCLAGNGVAPAGYFVVGDGAVIGAKQ